MSNISFSMIPLDLRTPGAFVEFDNSRAVQGLPREQHRILVLGQRLSTGTVAANVPTRISSAAQAEEAFGRGSMLSHMLAALKGANSRTDCWAIALDDVGAGAAAVGSITISGTATANGVIHLYVAGVYVPVPVASGTTAIATATAIAAAVNAKTDGVMTAAVDGVDTTKVNLTCRHKGEIGNALNLRVNYGFNQRLPASQTVVIVQPTGGTTSPDIATAIAAIAGAQYHTIVTPWTDASNLTKLESELATRWGPMNQRDGHAFAAVAGNLGAMTGLGTTRNSPHLTLAGAGRSPTAPWLWAAVVAAIDAAEPDPARPRQTLVLPGILPPADADRLGRADRELLLFDGVSSFVVDDGGRVLIERLITTYQTNASGLADTSYLDIETMRTLAYLRFSVRARILQRFPRHKLADDGTQFATGQAVATPSLIRAELLHLFREWELAGLVEGFEQFKADLVVERDSDDPNRVNAILPPDLVNQLRVFAAAIQFRV